VVSSVVVAWTVNRENSAIVSPLLNFTNNPAARLDLAAEQIAQGHPCPVRRDWGYPCRA
jgi:hypothetical protein